MLSKKYYTKIEYQNKIQFSKLVCITLGASGREWSTEMPQDEEILAIGAGDKLVAVATDQRILRLFTVFGTQREVNEFSISFPGCPRP